jgi:hypothetical protein
VSVRRPPRDCPVCGETLALTRLSCRACGTELSGDFQACEFCSLAPEDRELLRVFLLSRGNIKDVQRHLNVSYPTARVRFDGLLAKLGLDRDAAPTADGRLDVLRALHRGEIDVAEAERRLEP